MVPAFCVFSGGLRESIDWEDSFCSRDIQKSSNSFSSIRGSEKEESLC